MKQIKKYIFTNLRKNFCNHEFYNLEDDKDLMRKDGFIFQTCKKCGRRIKTIKINETFW
ncbi:MULTISPECIES: hypothetical protein [unclassified Lacrimispora]|uniref:hypothetical protein n=1 Tax=unclassified Lacrimispora TaxID=2719232 RepID=UPI00376FDA29